ncbi:uncharacterized protein MKZ38_005293 [Zalerion maritima]|uniref:Telomeric single stranded DNA binding POT1/Cdc13 domain-containing protein n=1 Tax=Zalerion maritima TaxID=339359 RepID=A0AAD5RKS9_9PEZI|nr:uncharacterized protein MKZ38_005293 [Zalerion maritima]
MASQNAADKPPLETLEAIPIAKLHPDFPDVNSLVVRAIITVAWPYNSIKKSLAFRISEPDFSLRRENGQVRVQFDGPSAEALFQLDIGSDDEVILSLDGADWTTEDQKKSRLSVSSINWQLNFKNKLRLQVKLVEQGGTKLIDIDQPDAPESPAREPTPDYTNDLPHEFSPAIPASSKPAKNHLAETLAADEYSYRSPAYLKRQRLSYGSLFEDPWEDDGGVKNKGRKRTRFGRDRTSWRYTSQSPTPEPEPEPELETEPQLEPQLKPQPEPQRSSIKEEERVIPSHSPTAAKDTEPSSKSNPTEDNTSQPNASEDIEMVASMVKDAQPDMTDAQVSEQAEGHSLDHERTEEEPPVSISADPSATTPAEATAVQDTVVGEPRSQDKPMAPELQSQGDAMNVDHPGPDNSIMSGNSDAHLEFPQEDVVMANSEPQAEPGIISMQSFEQQAVNRNQQRPDAIMEPILTMADEHPQTVMAPLPTDHTPLQDSSFGQYTPDLLINQDHNMQDGFGMPVQPNLGHEAHYETNFDSSHGHIIHGPHGVDAGGIAWAITSESPGPEPLQEQFYDGPTTEPPAGAPTSDFTTGAEARDSYPAYDNYPEETLDPSDPVERQGSSNAEPIDLDDESEDDNTGEYGDTDEPDEKGGDYDTRHYADIQDDEEGAEEESEPESSEKYYDEEEEEEGYGDENRMGENGMSEEGSYEEDDENHVYSQYQVMQPMPQPPISAPRAAPRAAPPGPPEVIDLISDSEEEEEGEEEACEDSEEYAQDESGDELGRPHYPQYMVPLGLSRNQLPSNRDDELQHDLETEEEEEEDGRGDEEGSGQSDVPDGEEDTPVPPQATTRRPLPGSSLESHISISDSKDETVELSKNNPPPTNAASKLLGPSQVDPDEQADMVSRASDQPGENNSEVEGVDSSIPEDRITGFFQVIKSEYGSASLVSAHGGNDISGFPRAESLAPEGSMVSVSVTGAFDPVPSIAEDDASDAPESTPQQARCLAAAAIRGSRQTSLEVVAIDSDSEDVHQQSPAPTVDLGEDGPEEQHTYGDRVKTSQQDQEQLSNEEAVDEIDVTDDAIKTPVVQGPAAAPVAESTEVEMTDAPMHEVPDRAADALPATVTSELMHIHDEDEAESPGDQLLQEMEAHASTMEVDTPTKTPAAEPMQPPPTSSFASQMEAVEEETELVEMIKVPSVPALQSAQSTQDTVVDAKDTPIDDAIPQTQPTEISFARSAQDGEEEARQSPEKHGDSYTVAESDGTQRDTESNMVTGATSDAEQETPVPSKPRRRGRPPTNSKPEPIHTGWKARNTGAPATRRSTRHTSRVTESPVSPSADQSIMYARASLAERRGSRQSNQGYEASSPRTTRSSFIGSQTPDATHLTHLPPSSGDGSVRLARAALRSPSKAGGEAEADVKPPTEMLPKTTGEESEAAVRASLEKTLKEELGEYCPLKALRRFVNIEKFAAIAVAVTTGTAPVRDKTRREYLCKFMVTDHSTAVPSDQVFEVRVWHRNREFLPIVKGGDGVLLRDFSVVSIHNKGFGLRSNGGSKCAVWETYKEGTQIRNGPVEVSEAEEDWGRKQMGWYRQLDEKTRARIQKEATKMAGEEGKNK